MLESGIKPRSVNTCILAMNPILFAAAVLYFVPDAHRH